MDKLSSLLGRYTFGARVFFNGDFCAASQFHEDGRTGHLHLVRKGPVVFAHAHGEVVRIEEPAMMFYPRGMSHRLEVPAGASATLLCATIAFEDGSANPLMRVFPDYMYLPLRELEPVRHTLDLLFAEASRARQGHEFVLDRLCDVLMIQVIRHQFDTGQLNAGMLAGLADQQLARVLDAMHARPHASWQVQSLASLACMSRTAFTEHFRNVLGMPPIEYLTRWRISLACQLLRKGLPVKVVSAQVGYGSQPAFTRAFTENVGMSPRQWLREREDTVLPA
ncbi:AraC family transcriptional regulator [Massilia sp. LXY-6]|uniref:AraC family transcriptional regulator n=1 Tax=Massilia sp. LXY-6 TaxID=3379823 RepID=UPI003EDF902A